MTATYDYARLYAQSEKAMTDRLNELVGKGNWMKTKRMLDTYGLGKSSLGDREATKPLWVCEEYSDARFTAHHITIYRGVIFKGDKSVNAKLFINPLEDRQPEDLVLVRSWHKVEIDDEARYWGIGERGLPWETKEEGRQLWEEAKANRYAAFEGRS